MIKQIIKTGVILIACMIAISYLQWLFISAPKLQNDRSRIERKIDSLYKERERVRVHIYIADSVTDFHRDNLAASRISTDSIITEILNGNENEAGNYYIVHRDSLCSECARATIK